MAWPCISRACCIARFWNQLDKADIAVPLVFTKYSEATELPGTQVVFQQQPARPLPSAIDTQPAALSGDSHARPASAAVEHGPPAPGPSSRVGTSQLSKEASSSVDSVTREDFRAWKVQRPEPSCKPKSEYQPSDQPFEKQSQYQKDFRPWPIPKRGDHPWIPKQMAIPAVELDKGTKERSSSWERRSRSQIGLDRLEQRKEETKSAPEERSTKTKKKVQMPEDQARLPHQQPGPLGTQEGGKGRAVVDALNRQIKEEVTARVNTSSYRNEFRPWTDIRPVRAIKAKSQYEPPDEKMIHQTSYSSQFTAEGAKPDPHDNKFLEHRRIRTLYKEPQKESSKVEKPNPQPSKPKKTTPSHKSVKKPKDKQMASSRASKKKGTETSSRTTAEDKEKSKEINNKLAEAKE